MDSKGKHTGSIVCFELRVFCAVCEEIKEYAGIVFYDGEKRFNVCRECWERFSTYIILARRLKKGESE